MFLSLFLSFLISLVLCLASLFALLALWGLKEGLEINKGKIFAFWILGAGADISLICIVAVCILKLFGYVQ